MPPSSGITARLPRAGTGDRAGRVGVPLGIGVAVLYMSVIALIPFAALVNGAFDNGWDAFWTAVTNERAMTALKLTVGISLVVVAINVVMGTIIAWVLVRDRFFGRTFLNSLIDLPFALPTIVAGVTLLAIYGPDSPVGVNLAFTRAGVCVALLLVTLPFVVRSVQPVLLELDREMEEAAASLGATPRQVFRRVILPNLTPAILGGAGLAFARALGEFGSLVLIAGTLDTKVSSLYIIELIEGDHQASAAAVSVTLLVISLISLLLLSGLERFFSRHAR